MKGIGLGGIIVIVVCMGIHPILGLVALLGCALLSDAMMPINIRIRHQIVLNQNLGNKIGLIRIRNNKITLWKTFP